MRNALVSPEVEVLLWALVLLGAGGPLAWRAWQWRRGLGVAVLVAGLGTAASGLGWLRGEAAAGRGLAAFLRKVPNPGRPGGYVTSDQCRSCHPGEHRTWHDSFHRTMTQVAGPGTVLGDFGVGSLEHEGETYRLDRRGDEYWVELPDPDAAMAAGARGKAGLARPPPERVWRRVGLLTGSHHMQVYWVTSGFGNLQHVFPFCWIIGERRWVPVRDTFLRDPSLPPYSQRWNQNCIRCHATGGQPRGEIRDGMPHTRVGELGIACEACHGPGERHVALHRDPLHRYAVHLGLEKDTSLVNPAKLPKKESAHVCGQCHGIKWVPASEKYDEHGFSYRPGDDLDRSTPVVRPARLDLQEFLREPLRRQPRFLDEHYWSDGEVRVSGREFNGLVDSPCFERGEMTCLSCHALHGYADTDDQFAQERTGNRACVACHAEIGEQPELHTHHAAGSAGGECYNCHMPHTTYGLLKAIRSHRVSSPDVAVTLATGRPNACNLCHLDRTLAWTAEKLSAWYGKPAVPVPEEHRRFAAAAVWALKGDAGQRALLAWHMGWEPARTASGRDWLAPFLGQALDDSYSAVRYIAHRSLKSLPGFEGFAFDYVGLPARRAEAARDALERWAAGTNRARAGEALLIGGDGRLNRVEFDRMLRERNQRSMDLQE